MFFYNVYGYPSQIKGTLWFSTGGMTTVGKFDKALDVVLRMVDRLRSQE